ncbi:MAG: UDP-N-acetylmuramoyl-L-alanine--D-glutamate ligase, partial [Ruminococcaceae bacterium]|nr:UDP-N-acetylmuramoyl-L-alanine--D-glutamate ligase [Oscillospiraceae bacterium]
MPMLFETYFENLRGKEIAVLGLGVSNRPLVRLLLEFGCRVSGGDRVEREKLDAEVLELERMGCKLYLGEHFYEEMTAQIAFRTPGMHPDSPAVKALRDGGA